MDNNPLLSLGSNEDQTGYKIIAKQELTHQIKQVKIHAPEIADKAKAIHEYLLRKSPERSTAQVLPNLPISCKVVRKK